MVHRVKGLGGVRPPTRDPPAQQMYAVTLNGTAPGWYPDDRGQLTDQHPISTPVDWTPGQRVAVSPSISTEDARQKFGEVEEVKPYLRWTPQPKAKV
jgi:hypothetical protein